MEIKNLVVLACIMLTINCKGQNTKLDTLRMFEGHWVYKMAMNTDYTPHELEGTYIKNVRGKKISLKGVRVWGDFFNSWYENYHFSVDSLSSNSGNFASSWAKEGLNKDLIEIKKLGIKLNQPWIGIYQSPFDFVHLPYGALQKLLDQNLIIVGIDQTMFFLERDKTPYKFIKSDSTNLQIDKTRQGLNHILKNEEVEILEQDKDWTKVRYWGKALLTGWVKTSELKESTSAPEYWNIYKSNTIRLPIKSSKAVIYDKNFQPTKMYLIKNDIIEVVQENGPFVEIIFHGKSTISGKVKREDLAF